MTGTRRSIGKRADQPAGRQLLLKALDALDTQAAGQVGFAGQRDGPGVAMANLDHAIERGADGSLVVQVATSVAGFVSRDAEYPGLWIVEEPGGRSMGPHLDRKLADAFVAAWFTVRDEE